MGNFIFPVGYCLSCHMKNLGKFFLCHVSFFSYAYNRLSQFHVFLLSVSIMPPVSANDQQPCLASRRLPAQRIFAQVNIGIFLQFYFQLTVKKLFLNVLFFIPCSLNTSHAFIKRLAFHSRMSRNIKFLRTFFFCPSFCFFK